MSELPNKSNFKVLLNFHTEYILGSSWAVSSMKSIRVEVSENGIVNGASFNYGLARDGPVGLRY
ncbi:MAG: DUF3114 domain-containing protein [Streptococcus parasanguinis]